MRIANFLLTLLIVISFVSCSRNTSQATFNPEKITDSTELNFFVTEKRGIKRKEFVFYVEDDLKTLTSYENGQVKWSSNILNSCGKPAIGKSEIRHIKLDTNTILVTFGKHSHAGIDINTGKTTFLGAD